MVDGHKYRTIENFIETEEHMDILFVVMLSIHLYKKLRYEIQKTIIGALILQHGYSKTQEILNNFLMTGKPKEYKDNKHAITRLLIIQKTAVDGKYSKLKAEF